MKCKWPDRLMPLQDSKQKEIKDIVRRMKVVNFCIVEIKLKMVYFMKTKEFFVPCLSF